MRKLLLEKFQESAASALPIGAIVLLLHLTVSPMPVGTLALFGAGLVLLILGMSIFTLGADMSMMPIGEHIGSELTRSRKILPLIIGGFALGAVVTIAEPDLQVLTKQVPSVPDAALIFSVAAGVGISLVVALMRIYFQMKLSYLLIVMYALAFGLAAFTSPDYLPVAFDSGGVTTGPITVPFILSLGIGVSAARSGKSAEEDSFGLCAVCSIGPILAVQIIGMFFDSSQAGYAFETPETANSVSEFFGLFGNGLLVFAKETAMALIPIMLIFIIFQIFRFKLPKGQVIKILVGILYTFIGLTIFLAGVNIGFMPAGTYLGKTIATLPYSWILYPFSLIIGVTVVFAEPAVQVLNKQVEEITSGAISRRMMMMGLSAGVGLALVLSMVRIMMRVNIWFFLLPGYAVAIILTFFVPEVFTAIAFDSGGVAAGSMAAAFLLPFAMGVCNAVGGNVMTDAFGIVAMVAMMPLITVQIMGLLYKLKTRREAIPEEITEEQESELITIISED